MSNQAECTEQPQNLQLNSIVEFFSSPNEIMVGCTRITDTHSAIPFPSFSLVDGSTYADVQQAYRQLAGELRCSEPQIISCKQTHSTTIVQIHEKPLQSVRNYQGSIYIADGLISALQDVVLAVSIADCAGVLLYHPQKSVIAALHSGWRGTYQRIVPEAIAMLCTTYGINPSELMAWISPCAHVESYEIQDDVAQYFPNNITIDTETGKKFFNNVSVIQQQLFDAGVPQSTVFAHPECTIVNNSYHSYRRDGKKSGRGLAFIGIGIAKAVSL